ncbi:MAG: YceI family protein [Calditrichaeota bacterium]|nr:MAG: YceI family protein [Calditrichota bacterium]MBL1207439.1 YceI family protein [Calditrichota bacterium]NOG47271.1 YceI family protein [Calditrichota bacterium]
MYKISIIIIGLTVAIFGQINQDNKNPKSQEHTNYHVSNNSMVEYVAETEMFFLFGSTINGKNSSVTGVINLDPLNLVNSAAKIIIDANGFTSCNDSRDEHIAEILKSKTHPQIIFILDSLSKLNSTDQSNNGFIAVGSLTVNGIKKLLSFPVVINRSSNEIKIFGEIEVLYSDFGMEPPTVGGGVVKDAKESILLKASIVAHETK